MTDTRVLRSTLEAIDDLVDRIRGRDLEGYRTADAPAHLVIDEGRAAAEWAIDLDLPDRVQRVGLLVVCDVAGDRLLDARLYVAPSTTRKD